MIESIGTPRKRRNRISQFCPYTLPPDNKIRPKGFPFGLYFCNIKTGKFAEPEYQSVSIIINGKLSERKEETTIATNTTMRGALLLLVCLLGSIFLPLMRIPFTHFFIEPFSPVV